MVNASFFEVDYALAMVARVSLLIAKSSGSVGWSCPETARQIQVAVQCERRVVIVVKYKARLLVGR